MSTAYTVKQAAIEAAPASAVAAAAVADAATNAATLTSLDDWMKGAAFVFLLLQITYMLWRWRRDFRRDREAAQKWVGA